MKSKILLFGVLLLLSLGTLQCSRCSSDESVPQDTDPVGEAIADGAIQRGSAALEWEQLTLEISRDIFKKKVAALFSQSLKDMDELFECGSQQGVWLIRPIKNSVLEHQSDIPLYFCSVSSMMLSTSLRISSVRGDFLDDKLLTAQFVFQPVYYDAIQSELKSRFGEGETRELLVHSVAGPEKEMILLWKVDGVVWSLKKAEHNAIIQMQPATLPACLVRRIELKKTDLSDIGLNGSPYDIKLDDLEVPEALRDSDAPSDTAQQGRVSVPALD